MAASRRELFRSRARAEDTRGRGRTPARRVVGPQALVHLWLLLIIVASVGILAVSAPLPDQVFDSLVVGAPFQSHL